MIAVVILIIIIWGGGAGMFLFFLACESLHVTKCQKVCMKSGHSRSEKKYEIK